MPLAEATSLFDAATFGILVRAFDRRCVRAPKCCGATQQTLCRYLRSGSSRWPNPESATRSA